MCEYIYIYDWVFFKVKRRYETNEPNQPLLYEETQFLSHVLREKIHSEIDLPKSILKIKRRSSRKIRNNTQTSEFPPGWFDSFLFFFPFVCEVDKKG